jgi:hypothetical protein
MDGLKQSNAGAIAKDVDVCQFFGGRLHQLLPYVLTLDI